jgi:hypothetical protein
MNHDDVKHLVSYVGQWGILLRLFVQAAVQGHQLLLRTVVTHKCSEAHSISLTLPKL